MKPAIAGGNPVFKTRIPFIRLNMYDLWNKDSLRSRLSLMMDTGELTGGMDNADEFERRFAWEMDAGYGVSLSSCTSGLMLAIQALGAKDVIMPSFTFSATAHACRWNNCKITFADIDDTLCIDPEDVKRKITDKTDLILGVHMYGLPCDVESLEKISEDYSIPVLYDAAHAVGSKVNGVGVGAYGEGNVFSFSPTKVLTTIEGGMLLTNSKSLSDKIKLDRAYSNLPDYTCERVGLSARMAEFNAAFGCEQVDDIKDIIASRETSVDYYKELLKDIPGVSFQKIPDGYTSSHKDFSIFIGDDFGHDRDYLERALSAEGIPVKKYFTPPIHKLEIYRDCKAGILKVTEDKANRVLSLPIYSYMNPGTIEQICFAIRRIHEY